VIITPLNTTTVRCIPSYSTEPLAIAQTVESPGRWNTAAFPVLYTFVDAPLARAWAGYHIASNGLTLEDLPPEYQSDLVILNCSLANVVNLTTAEALEEAGLSNVYPDGYGTDTYPETQLIAERLRVMGHDALLVRSASATFLSESETSGLELVSRL
jgi:hypothetical protein